MNNKKRNDRSFNSKGWEPLVRIPLLVLGIAAIFSIQVNAMTHQGLIALKLNNATISEAVKIVEKQSHYKFVYNNNEVDASHKISVNANYDSIEEVAEAIFSGYDVEVKGNHVIISRKRTDDRFAGNASQQTVQKRTITGHVTEGATGEPLIGVSIRIKGTGMGTVTDIDGYYSIVVDNNRAVLEFSYVGFLDQEIAVDNLGVIDIQMNTDATQLEEVVIVGAGVQKKVSVTGSITSVKGQTLRMPTSSLTSAFAGQLAGVISMTTSGAPGSTSEFYIRGIGTFGGRATPLIMLDDVEISAADLNNIPAETIESFSILKDASATAIYGSRGANGVMLVKTKDGNVNERTKINVTVEQSFNTPMNFPEFVDGATWMELYNEALISRTPNATPRYSQDAIDATRSGINPYVYPDVNWKDVIFRDMATNQRANINIQGGGQKATYYMSIQANHDTGLLNSKKAYSWDNNINNWGYNFQNNISYKLTEGTKVDLRMNAQIRQYKSGDYTASDLFAKMQAANPISFPVTFPAQEGDEHIRFGSSVLTGNTYRENIYATMLNSFKETQENTINTSLKVSQNFDFITKGLSATMLVNFKNWSQNGYNRSIEPYLYRVLDGSYNPGTQEYEIERLGTSGTDFISQSDISKSGDHILFIQGTIDYSRNFGLHNVGGMLLYTQREYKVNVLPSRNQGISGRFTYAYDNRYLAEANFGYTGTERLASGSRFEFFPAISLGWVMSEESFFEPIANTVSFLKFRGSYGLIGSDETGLGAGAPHFLYINQVNLSSDGSAFTTGENLGYQLKGPQMLEYAVNGAGWEKVKKLNLGIDMELFGSLNVTADYFYDKRYDILLKREAWPESLGYYTAKPWANKGKMDNWGYEISANFNRQLTKDLVMELRGNFTYTQNKYVDVDDPIYKYPWQSSTGKPASRVEGFIAEGLFTSQEEIDNSPVQNLGSTPKPGDIKYRDITGDGIIDDFDKTMISEYGSVPRIQYGFGASMRYKNFDFGVFFNGSAKRTIVSGLMAPFGQNDQNVFQYIADNRWSVDNPNPDAKYPRLGLLTTDTQNNAHTSTYWMRNGNFLRLKQLELGYSFNHGRVYLSGNNLAVFGPFKQWDPELSWNAYPLQRVFNLGVQLSF
ncbi:TonB-dependent receptor [Proteiniphilum sp.]|uniref:TonB-dependent receptor n=1 Tax=Proteiniphilum sp. TaxID=1926877 RepID=UPI00332B4D33